MKLRITLLFLILFCSCGPTQQVLSDISINMTKQEVKQQIGKPNTVRGSITNKYGQVVEVWEYRLYQYSGAVEGLSPYYDLYWLYFVDSKLVQWGQAGDWQREADKIYEIRFR